MIKPLLLLLVTFFSCAAFCCAQSTEKLYRTAFYDEIYTKAEIDSIRDLGRLVDLKGEKVVDGTSFIMVDIYPDLSTFLRSKYRGKPLPDINLKTLDGRTITSKELKGKVVMIHIWATTCGPCIKEFPELNRLYEDYKDKVVFLAPLPQDKTKANSILTKHPFYFTVSPSSSELLEQLGIRSYPTNFFVDREGIVREVTAGAPLEVEESDLKSDLEGAQPHHVSAAYKNFSAIFDKLLEGSN